MQKIEKLESKIHGGEGFELMKPAREPTSSRPKLCASLETTPRIMPVRRFLSVRVRKNGPWLEINFSLRNLPVRAFGFHAEEFSTPLARR